ncbi:MAG TPA: MmcQ/YjbR family DNA-binding protein [Acidimicrobiales bacterium]|nr:MmcQ/YjbR family DNA-binding protein [Acidimicrobiales bacterium]
MRGDARSGVEAVSAAICEVCLALPETTEKAESWARNFEVRRRSFCLFLTPDSPFNNTVPVLVLRSTDDDREMYLAMGHPFFEIPRNNKRVGLVLSSTTDWEEVRELVTDSYCMIAPKKLIALLDLPPDA